jgi:hypothetical protein
MFQINNWLSPQFCLHQLGKTRNILYQMLYSQWCSNWYNCRTSYSSIPFSLPPNIPPHCSSSNTRNSPKSLPILKNWTQLIHKSERFNYSPHLYDEHSRHAKYLWICFIMLTMKQFLAYATSQIYDKRYLQDKSSKRTSTIIFTCVICLGFITTFSGISSILSWWFYLVTTLLFLDHSEQNSRDESLQIKH